MQRTLFVCLSLLAVLGRCHAQLTWGPKGHSVAAAIAQSLLTKKADAKAWLLLNTTMSDEKVASYADNVRMLPQYSWSKPLHFIDTPDWVCNYDYKRDCRDPPQDPAGQIDFCADGAIVNFTRRAADNTLPPFLQAQAVKFLIHFIGDIHQPMHVSFVGDRGGNSYNGTFDTSSKKINLHSLWDSVMINKRIKDDFDNDMTKWQDYLINRVKNDLKPSRPHWEWCSYTTAPFSACSTDWAVESLSLACNYGYVDVDGKTHIKNNFHLGVPYYNRVLPIIELQIAKAGVRLAHVLNAMWK